MNKKSIFFTILLLAILSISSIMALLAAKKITVAYTSNPHTPDFFMTNVVYTQFDQNGDISNKFYASKLSHLPKRNSYTFNNPIMQMHNVNEQPWDITAKQGESELGKSKIYLKGDVKLVQPAGPNNTLTNITTSSLIIYPNTKIAETNDPITIIQNDSIIKSIGANTDFKAGIVNLLSNVECQYQAN